MLFFVLFAGSCSKLTDPLQDNPDPQSEKLYDYPIAITITGECHKPNDPPVYQGPTWEKVLDLQGKPKAIMQTDNGYIITGSYGYGQPGDFLFAEIDSMGELLWCRRYVEYGHQVPWDMVKTPNGYLAVGISDPTFAYNYRIKMIAVDNAGNKLWEKSSFYGYWETGGRDVTACDDGGYVIVGRGSPWTGDPLNPSAGSDALVIKVDEDGDSVWALSVDWGGNSDIARSVCRMPDGSFAVSGDNFFGGELCFMRISANGELIGEVKKHDGDSGWKMADHMIAIPDGFLITGTSKVDDISYATLWKLSPDGELIWKRTYGGAANDIGMSVAFDGESYILVGSTFSFGVGKNDVFILRTDLSGNQLWLKTYGGTEPDGATSVLTTSDGGIVVLGLTKSFGAGQRYYVLRTDSEGNIHPADSLQ